MNKLLLVILLFGLVLRFLYFPENVYFGYDQARDAYESLSIYREGNIKIIGPSTSSPDLFHGPLYWYLIGPWYILRQGNPIYPAAFLLVLNALGILVIFYL